jgi:hypothetical protein
MRAAYKASAAGQVQQVERGEKRKAEAKRSQAIGEGSKAALNAFRSLKTGRRYRALGREFEDPAIKE